MLVLSFDRAMIVCDGWRGDGHVRFAGPGDTSVESRICDRPLRTFGLVSAYDGAVHE
jgi:hypothetical protein